MFVSILQLMGLAPGKPIQSRADPNTLFGPASEPSKVDTKGMKRQDEPAARRRSRPAPSESAVARRSSSLRRQEVKSQTAKPQDKSSKGAVKTAAKLAVSSRKGAAKPAVKLTDRKAAPALRKPEPKPVAKPPEKKSSKPVSVEAAAPVAAKAPAKAGGAASAVQKAPPARTSRPSRLSQITVPSMAQSVASTAAKATYAQTMSSPVLTPPAFVPIKKDPKLANNWKTKPVDQLSDAEVLAMPDEEYMNEKQMAFFRLKLQQLKDDILSNAGETTEHLREDTVVVPDPADRATIEEEHALELRTRDRERKLLKKIEQSIARIDAGDYGYCDETGEPIGVGRLLARPTATLSLEAQQRRELKQKMFGD